MAGSTGEDYGLESGSSSVEGMSSGQVCPTGDSLREWRSSEQVENGTPSTSPLYWDTDDDDDFGPKPSDLYGKFTWKIENFSQITKRELRSIVFEVGGYKWYILIYPQGCDVCNHLSLFLCVANHDKLLPGWSHFAQFTIAVVNKDSKKSKYSDTLHRFWKKEHDWGWKKFMELSKLSDGFIVADALVIKAQVQVIREKTHRPFRCLDFQYRRELVRVYLSNVEQLCRRYVEEKRGKFSKMIEDRVRWSSFRSFWLGVDQNGRRWMSRDKAEAILKVVVKHFFIEKEVTSTLVMDSLYSGLKAIESQNKFNRGTSKLLDMEEMSVPFVYVEKDMFVLTDDVLLLLEKAALGPILPKDEKGAQNQNQNRTKDSSSGEEFTKDSIEPDERRLTELGRRTVEIFVLNHIFSRIEVAYQEAVALKRQEELIREEEAAGQAENELKSKRSATEKEKRMKKKQAKQKRNGRKGKERVRDEKCDTIVQEKSQEENISSETILEDLSENQALSVLENVGDVSDLSDTVDDVSEALQPDLDERDASRINWDADALEINPTMEAGSSETQNDQAEKKSQSVLDDSSSTCSTDSIPSVGMNGPYKRNALSNNKSSSSPSRVKSQLSRNLRDQTSQAYGDANKLQPDCTTDASHPREVTVSCKATAAESKAVVVSLRDSTQRLEQHLFEKEEVAIVQKKASSKGQVDDDRSSKPRIAEQSSFTSRVKNPPSSQQPKRTSEINIAAAEPVPIREPSSNSESQAEKLVSIISRSTLSSKLESKPIIPAKIAAHQVSAVPRPPSAPLIPGPRPTVPLVSMTQAAPLLSRSVSAAGRLGTDTSTSTHSNVPQSYRNAIMCKTTMGANTPNFAPHLSSSSTSHTPACSQPLPSFILSSSAPLLKCARMDHASVRPGFTFGSVNPESLQTQHQWIEESLQLEATSSMMHNPSLVSDIRRLDISGTRPCLFYFDEATNVRQALGVNQDEFPHLDIINDLLDEEHSVGKFGQNDYHQQHHPTLNRQFTFPGDISNAADVGASNGSSYFDRMGQYYDDGMQRVYGSSDGRFNRRRDLASEQLDISAYVNGQFEGVSQSQWPMGSMDNSILGSAEADAYMYRLPDSSNVASGLNGYAIYRPANGL